MLHLDLSSHSTYIAPGPKDLLAARLLLLSLALLQTILHLRSIQPTSTPKDSLGEHFNYAIPKLVILHYS